MSNMIPHQSPVNATLIAGKLALDVNIAGGGGGGGNVTVVGPLGQALSAASVPVVIASDQSAIPVQSSAQASATGNTKLLTVTHVSAVAVTTVVACGNVT